MKQFSVLIVAGLICAGCNQIAWNSDILNGTTGGGVFKRPSDPTPQRVEPDTGAPLDATAGVNTTYAPVDVPTQGAVGRAGTTVATLGDPSVPGLWLETGLVSEAGSGRVRTASGRTLDLTLKPIPGDGGSRLSLDAMRALGVPLTELVELSVQPLG